LKKIVSSLTARRPASEAAALALGVLPGDLLTQPPPAEAHLLQNSPAAPHEPPFLSTSGQDDDRGPDFQYHKAAFFFKLERELEKVRVCGPVVTVCILIDADTCPKINAFYLRKEAELKLRLETLLSKRRAAAMGVLPDEVGDTAQNYVEWKAVEEGFHLLERDLAKLQVSI